MLHATRLRIPIVEVEGGTLTAVAGFDGHQGIALVVAPRRFAAPEEVLARAVERGEPPFVLVIDSLEDPQNLGTLLRSAEAAGVHGVLFPTRRQAPLTPAAIKASAGAVEHLLLCPVDDLAGALADLHVRGLRIAGAEENAPLTARQTDLRGPLAIVVGSEGQGLGPAVRRRCDTFMRIPMRGAVGSLNAAVAGSILLFEAVAQRDPEGRTAPPRDDAARPWGAEPVERVLDDPGDAAEPPPSAGPDEPAAIAREPGRPAEDPSGDDPEAAPAGEPAAAGLRATAEVETADVETADVETPAPEASPVPAPPRRRTRASKAAKAAADPAAEPAREPAAEPEAASEPAVAEDDLLPGGPPPEPTGEAPSGDPEPPPSPRRRRTPRA